MRTDAVKDSWEKFNYRNPYTWFYGFQSRSLRQKQQLGSDQHKITFKTMEMVEITYTEWDEREVSGLRPIFRVFGSV